MLGDMMKAVLKASGETQNTASEKLGISQGGLNLWLNNKRSPSPEEIKKFCEVFNTTPNYLFGFDDGISESDRALLQAFKTLTKAQASNNQNPNIPEQTSNER